ncbi:MAG: hypothetical protein EA392_04130, partial [Cryomorphaceae bacterium]
MFQWYRSVILPVFLIMMGLTSMSYAQGLCDLLVVPDEIEVEVNENFQMTLRIDVPPGQEVSVVDILMSFDPAVVNVTNVAIAPGSPLPIQLDLNINNTTGVFNISAFSLFGTATTSFDAFVVSLVGVADGFTALQYESSPIPPSTNVAFAGNNITGDFFPGLITVGDGPDPECIEVEVSLDPIDCFGGTTTVTITATEGTPPYTYTLGSESNSTGVFEGVPAGSNIAWSVDDSVNCGPLEGTINITQPDELTASASAGTIDCFGGTTTVTLSASGGTGPYSYTLGSETNSTGVF